MDIRYYDSKATGSTRRAFVYTPPGLRQDRPRSCQCLYLLHGADGDETVWTTFGRVNLILDNLIADKKAAPMIVVTPAAYAYPPTTGVAGDKQRTDFEKDLLERSDPVRAGELSRGRRSRSSRARRIVDGWRSDAGDRAASPRHVQPARGVQRGRRQNPQESMKDVAANAKNVNAQLKLFWMAIGDEDPGYLGAKRTSDFLNSAGIKHSFKTMPGAHTWIVWRRFLNEVAPQLWGTTSGTN